MSVTVHSRIVDLDDLIPRVVDMEQEENDVTALIPWIFKHSDTATESNIMTWPNDEVRMSSFFDEYTSYCSGFKAWRTTTDAGRRFKDPPLQASETITLPRKSWDVPDSREYGESGRWEFGSYVREQGRILQCLLSSTSRDLLSVLRRVQGLGVKGHRFKMSYVIGGKRYGTRVEGALSVGPPGTYLPIISFTFWFEGQTWNEFLVETISVMLGQLAKNLGARDGVSGSRDQEVYVVGFHGLHLHIVRGYFAANVVSRVYSKGFSENETFELNFSRGYNLSLKEDWLAASRGLTRLFRYFMSGSAKIGVLQAQFSDKQPNEAVV